LKHLTLLGRTFELNDKFEIWIDENLDTLFEDKLLVKKLCKCDHKLSRKKQNEHAALLKKKMK